MKRPGGSLQVKIGEAEVRLLRNMWDWVQRKQEDKGWRIGESQRRHKWQQRTSNGWTRKGARWVVNAKLTEETLMYICKGSQAVLEAVTWVIPIHHPTQIKSPPFSLSIHKSNYRSTAYGELSLPDGSVQRVHLPRRHGFDPWVGKIPWRRKRQPTPVFVPAKSMDRGAWRATVRGATQDSDTT